MLSSRLIGLLIVFLLTSSCAKNSFDEQLRLQQIPLDFDSRFDLIEFSNSPTFLFARSKSADEFIKIKWIPVNATQDLQVLVNEQILILFSQFHYIPFKRHPQRKFGKECNKIVKPRILKVAGRDLILAFADYRLALCTCLANRPQYRRITAFFIDKKKQRFYTVNFFTSDLNNSASIVGFFNKFSLLDNLKIQHWPFSDNEDDSFENFN